MLPSVRALEILGSLKETFKWDRNSIPERLVSKKIAESNTDVIILHDIKLVKELHKQAGIEGV